MIKFLAVLALISFNCLAGISVLGTRFVINQDTKRLNISIMNDNESDYLIQTKILDGNDVVSSDNFVISPPLFVLPKEATNIVTIIPNNLPKTDRDYLYRLAIASIPKSQLSENKSTVSLAVRANFHLIYRHADLATADFSQLRLSKHKDGKFYLKNNSNFVFTIALSMSKDGAEEIKQTLSTGEVMPLSALCKKADSCNVWVSFIDDDESVIKKINLFGN